MTIYLIVQIFTDMLPQHLICKYELNCEYGNINLARKKAPWWWSDKIETCRSVLKVFYVKLYVHSLVDKLKWFYENARCYNKIYYNLHFMTAMRNIELLVHCQHSSAALMKIAHNVFQRNFFHVLSHCCLECQAIKPLESVEQSVTIKVFYFIYLKMTLVLRHSVWLYNKAKNTINKYGINRE